MSHLRGTHAGSVPDRVSGADRSSGVARGCLQVTFCEASSIFDLAVSNRVIGAAASERDGGATIVALQCVQQIKKSFLIDGLGGKRQTAVSILDRRVGTALWT